MRGREGEKGGREEEEERNSLAFLLVTWVELSKVKDLIREDTRGSQGNYRVG